MVDKNKLREVTVGTQHTFKRETVEWEGQEFEIREPSVYVRGQIMNKSGMGISKDNSDINFSNAQIAAVIYCTYVPGTDDLVFSEKDVSMLQQQPSGGFVDKFSSVAMRLMNNEDAIDEDEGKN